MFSTILVVLGMLCVFSISKMRKALAEATTASETPVHQGHEVDQEQPDYFTYETMNSEMDMKTKASRPIQSFSTEDDSLEMVDKTQFDLRQAVIYQTILQNDYIADLK